MLNFFTEVPRLRTKNTELEQENKKLREERDKMIEVYRAVESKQVELDEQLEAYIKENNVLRERLKVLRTRINSLTEFVETDNDLDSKFEGIQFTRNIF